MTETSETSNAGAGTNPTEQKPLQAPTNPKKHFKGRHALQEARHGHPVRTREVHPVLEQLFELYPHLFGARFLPLKLGIFQDLLACHPDVFKRDELKTALGLHARSTRYLESVALGHPRHDLQGVPVEPVAPEHVYHAILEVHRRRQARSKEDLRPRLVARLAEAIDASALNRQDYAERVRAQDEAAHAVLDDAFAELAGRQARREALKRAFEASGCSTEQFAEMYGLQPAEVAQILGPKLS